MRSGVAHTRGLCRALAVLFFACAATKAFGWADATHRALVRGAAVALPEQIVPFFAANSDFIAVHTLDPDYLPNRTRAQAAEHFLDIDAYGPPPFRDPPHDRAEAERKFSAATVIERGLLPWTVDREYNRLVKAFEKRDWAETRLAAAHLAHFLADSTMPLHATLNYDGQKTDNFGIHRRIEVELVNRYHNAARVPAGPTFAVGDPVEWSFREIERGWAWCPLLFRSDVEARLAGPLDSEAYYAALERSAGFVVETRTRDAATAIASFWKSAWEKAGRPALPPQRCIVVLVERNSAPPEKKEFSPSEIVRAIAAVAGPFDAVAAAGTNLPPDDRRQSLHFTSACDLRDGFSPTVEGVGRISEALPTAGRAFAQFPGAQRVLLVATDGWAADERLPATLGPLKSSGARLLFFSRGTPAELEAARKFASDAGATFFELGDAEDVPATVARRLPPVDAP